MSDASGVLNLGSGRKKIAGAVNVDISDQVGADVVHDLTRLPWPLPSDTFREVHAQDVIEHLSDTVRVMEEIYRICRNGALVHITVPHFSSANAYTDLLLGVIGQGSGLIGANTVSDTMQTLGLQNTYLA